MAVLHARSPVAATELREARATTRRVARTFALASRLLPRPVRDDVHLLYLVLRTLDDAVDHGHPDADGRLAAVERWAAGGAPVGREAALLSHLEARYGMPRPVVGDFCAGMRDDLVGRTIETEEDLDRYCYRAAGTVGVCMAHVLGMRDPVRALPAAEALGKAMQRTNILRDIDEDAAAGRCYVPRVTVERFGPPLPGRREALLRQEIARADLLYDEGLRGVRHLHTGRRAILAAAGMYREILRQIERDGYGARPGRAVVSGRRKAAVTAATLRAERAQLRPHGPLGGAPGHPTGGDAPWRGLPPR